MQKRTAKDIRHMYMAEVKKSLLRRIGRTIFTLALGALAIVLADAAVGDDDELHRDDA